MGQPTIEMFAGGAVLIQPTVNVTLAWWWNRRVQTIRAANPGLTMTIQSPTAYPTLPFGMFSLVIINPSDATNSFTLRDQPVTWSFSVIPGKTILVLRQRNGAGFRWWPAVYDEQ